jgi:hypothetical protein
MNKGIFYILIGIFSCSTLLPGCFSGEKDIKAPKERTVNQYVCPMKCTDQIFEKPGKCPKCGMDLIKVTEG